MTGEAPNHKIKNNLFIGGENELLDGWRGVSILCILAGHLVPLSPKHWVWLPFNINAFLAVCGMTMFLILSGFLIAQSIDRKRSLRLFLQTRVSRIIPLAYLFIFICGITIPDLKTYFFNHLLFLNNYFGASMYTSHLWSICVEVHFYFLAGTICALAGYRRMREIAVVLLVVSLLINVVTQASLGPQTHVRISSCLMGFTIYHLLKKPYFHFKMCSSLWAFSFFLIVHVLLSIRQHTFLSALIPLSGGLLFVTVCFMWPLSILRGLLLRYIGCISYALFVWHPIFQFGWWAEYPNLFIKVLKRAGSIVLSFIVAHLSTFYFEARFHKIRNPFL